MRIGSTTKMTAEQFLQLGEDPPGVRLELVTGEVAVSPSPVPGHSYADSMLRYLLLEHILERDLGELFGDVDTRVDRFNVRRPDILYFAKDRLHLVGETAMHGPPDLCVEIVSPSSETIDRVDKFEQYRGFGVANYWIVDPQQRTVEAYQLRDGQYVATGRGRDADVVALPPFPELQLPLGRLWRRRPPQP